MEKKKRKIKKNKESKKLLVSKKLMIMDSCNVAALIPITDSLYDSGRLELEGFEDWEFKQSDWNNVVLDVEGEHYWCERTLVNKEYVDKFLNLARVWFDRKSLKTKDLELFERKIKECPVVLCCNGLGMIIAPRQTTDESLFKFENYKEQS